MNLKTEAQLRQELSVCWQMIEQDKLYAAKRDASILEYQQDLQIRDDHIAEQTAEISQLKGIIEKCSVTLNRMKAWFDAEDNHEGTTFHDRVEMCNLVQIQTSETLAAIKELKP